ncbi:hypothetical protein [Halomonas elongata]|uniref:hypothetical protein n=1 Tax=Halomonas elongata TaxID=2746 RepID=UPI00186B68AC|nr:hypothetical protein [Halomonas elongata]MBW5801140.1 hypothetical protein [Halomonas elongata]
MVTPEDAERRYSQLKGERDHYRRMVERRDEEIERLRETARLAERFARAKGRHHSGHAACDLMERFGVPCVRPGDELEMVKCACGDMYPPDSYGAGFMAANGGVCENCDMMNGGGNG